MSDFILHSSMVMKQKKGIMQYGISVDVRKYQQESRSKEGTEKRKRILDNIK